MKAGLADMLLSLRPLALAEWRCVCVSLSLCAGDLRHQPGAQQSLILLAMLE